MLSPQRKHTVDHLKELTDEVKDLHPVLRALFSKLPDISKVHYNHGSNELGADFILFKTDRSLKRTSCIGVVVKAGSILQNTTDVERQIKECFIARKGADAVEIQIREVWVVSSQEISNNARAVINKLYADRKVEFIPGQDLAKLIDDFAPDSFVTVSPMMQEYSEATLVRLHAEDQRSLIVPGMESFYVEPTIIRCEVDGYAQNKSNKKLGGLQDLLKHILNSQLSIIQAGAGGGKSRLARELVKGIFASADFADGNVLPALTDAKNIVADVESGIQDVLGELKSKLSPTAKVVLLVDGFDEIDLEDSERYRFVDELMKVASESSISVAILSRPFDESTILRGRLRSLDIFRIEPLRGQKAIDFLAKVGGQMESKSRLVSDLRNSLLLKALDGAPIAYILLGRLLAESQHDLPSNLTELFQKYCELVLGRWEIAKGLRSQQEYEVLVECLVWLSTYLLKHQISEISRNELEQWISQYCAVRNDIPIVASALVDKVCDRNSILYFRSDIGTVGFRHRAFSEFFFAKQLDRERIDNLSAEVFSSYWVNSYYFLAGIKKDCPELFNSILKIELTSESEKLTRIIHYSDLLLAGYMTPSVASRDGIREIVRDLAAVYIGACDPVSSSVLRNYPTIQLLCIFCTLFRDKYGYKHFAGSLEELIYEVEAADCSEVSAISLFFLNLAYKEAGGELRFDSMLEKYGEYLPLVVKLAIKHEAERMKQMSDRVKKMERNLRRSFKSRAGSGKFLDNLYRIPIKNLDKKLL